MPRLASVAAVAALVLSLSACGSSGGGPECDLPADCPGTDAECSARTCTSGTCGISYTPAGTPLAGQTAGDCLRSVCDGAGGMASAADDADVADDGNPCTIDGCSGGAPTSAPATAGTPCGTGLLCDGAGACVQCTVPAQCPGADTACRVRTCSAGTCGFQDLNGAACDDGDGCTVGDVCASGACQGGLPVVCDDGLGCTTDACLSTGSSTHACVHTPVPGACAILGACFADGEPNSANECEACDPAASQTSFSPRPEGTPCDYDGNGCTVGDSCNPAGACQRGTPALCDDFLACTSDFCTPTSATSYECSYGVDPGSCVIAGACWASGTSNPVNPCQSCNPAVSATAWTNRPAGTACDADGNGCTAGDACDGAGACQPGPPPSCDDGRACTADSCVSTGPTSYGCSSVVIPGSCLIAGACWTSGAPNPANPCQFCSPATSATAWTNRPAGTVCGPGQVCNGAGTCL